MAHEATVGLARKHGLALVYHAIAFTPGVKVVVDVVDVVNEVGYELVAAVETNDPEVAFWATNHIDEELKEAQPFWYGESRSTSVGDVIVTPDGLANQAIKDGWLVSGRLA